MLSLKNSLPARIGRPLLLLGLLVSAVRGHSTVALDQNTASLLSGLGNQGDPTAGPLLAHSVATVRLRADDLQMDITAADSAAYALLEADLEPSTEATELHFERDQPRLIQRAAELFTLTNNGKPLQPLAAAVELTSTQDIIFHLTYPHVTPGPFRLQANYVDKIPPSERILVEVLDGNRSVLAYSSLGPGNPAMDVALPAPSQTPPQAVNYGEVFGLIGAMAAAAGLFFLIGKLRRQPPPAAD